MRTRANIEISIIHVLKKMQLFIRSDLTSYIACSFYNGKTG